MGTTWHFKFVVLIGTEEY